MPGFFQVFQNYLMRFIYGRSIFRLITLVTLVALTLICLSKFQLFQFEKVELNKITDGDYLLKFSKLVKNEKIIKHLSFQSQKINSTIIKSDEKIKETVSLFKNSIFSGNNSVKFNSSLVVLNDNLIKFISNEILIKDMNENSIKLDKSLKSKPFDYDKNARFCICSKISQPCECCVKLDEEIIGLTKSLCSNITYIPKSKAAKVSIRYGKISKPNEYVLVDIKSPPPVCLSQLLKFDAKNQEIFKQKLNDDINLDHLMKTVYELEICFQARNLTYHVNVDASHKTEFKGCSNFYVKLNNMTVHIYPLGCFKAGYDNKDLQIQKMANGIQ